MAGRVEVQDTGNGKSTDKHRETERVQAAFFFSGRRRPTSYIGDWSSDVCSSDLFGGIGIPRYHSRGCPPPRPVGTAARPAPNENGFGPVTPAAPAPPAAVESGVPPRPPPPRPPRSEERRVG